MDLRKTRPLSALRSWQDRRPSWYVYCEFSTPCRHIAHLATYGAHRIPGGVLVPWCMHCELSCPLRPLLATLRSWPQMRLVRTSWPL